MGLTKDLGALPRVLAVSGSSVGIGTTTPANKLDVYGGSTSTYMTVGRDTGFVELGAGLSQGLISSYNSSSVLRTLTIQGSEIALNSSTSATERVRITSGGNVGIGTSSPAETLDVAGSVRITGQATNFSAGLPGLNIDRISASGIIRIYGVTGTGAAGDLAIGTNNTERIRISTIGNVGIGTTTPLNGGGNGRWLTLEGTSYSGGVICSINGVSTGALYSESGYYNMQASTGYGIKLFSNGGEALKIDTSGRVTTPQQPAFRAWYSINATWTVASNAVFNFNVTEYNIGNCFNTSNGTFTAPVAGVYQFNFYTIVLSTYTNGAISFRKNGGVATSGYNVHFSPTAADAWSNVVYTTSMYLNQGDYVNMVNAGGFSTNFHGKDWSSFSGYLVG